MASGRDNQGTAGLPDEAELLRQARAVLPALPDSEPRPGFAQRVAAHAMDERPRPLGAPWWRWAFGGAALASGAAAFLLLLGPRAPAPGGEAAMLAGLSGPELQLAQRLDLYEDLAVVQDQEALEDMDVVSVLHELQGAGEEPARTEGKP